MKILVFCDLFNVIKCAFEDEKVIVYDIDFMFSFIWGLLE